MEEGFDIHRPQPSATEREFENALRPLRFEDFSGQKKVVDNLRVFVEAAKYRGEPLDHTLLHGPPGLGKTTLSNIIANELGVGFKVTSGPVLDKPGDLAGILTSLEPNDVLFIDEIHRLSPVVEEYLYSAMEDYRIDIMIDKGPSARSIQIDLNPFTLVGATTRSGLLTAPLRARFGINLHLEYYDAEVLSRIVERSARILAVPIEREAALEIAGRSRGTPRIANALLRRVRDFAQVRGSGRVDMSIARYALEALNIDRYGLDEIDNKILLTIIDKFKGGPVGITTIATAIGEDAGTVEEVYEPFLIKEGFIKRRAVCSAIRKGVKTMITYQTEGVKMPNFKKRENTAWVKAVAAGYGKKVGEIAYIFVDDEKILEVNRQYLQHDYYTDIITFDYTEGDTISGDLFISLDTVRTNAEQVGASYDRELHRVIIHGILHLCGINDKGPGEREVMEAAEDKALAMHPSLGE